MTNETLITQEGLQKLKDELNELKSVRRINVSQRIKEAIALGDLSENSEYDDAKMNRPLSKAVLPNWKEKSGRQKLSRKRKTALLKFASVLTSFWKTSKPVTASTIPSSVRLKPIPSTTGFRMNLR